MAYDITKLNVAIDKQLEKTQDPLHRFMLLTYARHRALEVAGRYEEIFDPNMMAMNPVYHVHTGGYTTVLRGQDQVKSLYKMWSETNQAVFYVEKEEVAVADHFIASVVTGFQQVTGKALKQTKLLSHLPHKWSHTLLEKALSAKGWEPNDKDVYLYRMDAIEMIWPFDARGRVAGEDVWEPDQLPADRLQKLSSDEVMTTEKAAKLLAPIIKPQPSFDEMVLNKRGASAA
jgi:hypothetical protein